MSSDVCRIIYPPQQAAEAGEDNNYAWCLRGFDFLLLNIGHLHCYEVDFVLKNISFLLWWESNVPHTIYQPIRCLRCMQARMNYGFSTQEPSTAFLSKCTIRGRVLYSHKIKRRWIIPPSLPPSASWRDEVRGKMVLSKVVPGLEDHRQHYIPW